MKAYINIYTCTLQRVYIPVRHGFIRLQHHSKAGQDFYSLYYGNNIISYNMQHFIS